MSPEPVAGEFRYEMSRELLALALYAQADEQGIAVSDVDLHDLLMRVAGSDAHAWLVEPASRLCVTDMARVLAGPDRTREAVMQARGVLNAHRPVPEVAELAAADREFGEPIEGINRTVRRLGDHLAFACLRESTPARTVRQISAAALSRRTREAA